MIFDKFEEIYATLVLIQEFIVFVIQIKYKLKENHDLSKKHIVRLNKNCQFLFNIF